MLEGNITADAITLQNISSNLEVIDHEMTMIADMVHIQQDSEEQLIENMTVLSIDLISLNYSLNDLEARINASEFSWLHNENRMDKLELSHSLETALNEEQEATINKMEEELNETVAIIQGFIKGTTETPGKITKTRPCNIQRFFSSIKIKNFTRKVLIFLIYLLKTYIVGTR